MNPTSNDPRKAKSPAVVATGLFKAESKTGKSDQSKYPAERQSCEAELLALESRINANLRAAGFGNSTLRRPSIGKPLREQCRLAKLNLQANKWALEVKEFQSEDALLYAYADFEKQTAKLEELERKCREAGV